MAEKKRVTASAKKPKAKAPKKLAPETHSDEAEEMTVSEDQTHAEPAHYSDEEQSADKPTELSVPRPVQVRTKPSDEYTVQSFFDKATKQFVATVVEFPELKVTGTNRQLALTELEEKIEEHLYELRTSGQFIAEPVQSRVYPERLDIAISQSLYRKLDLISRQEKMPIDRLVSELLAGVLGKSQASISRQPQHRQPQHQQHGGQHQGGNHQQNRHQNNRHHGGQQRHQGRPNPRDIDNRENFMEYVRNLEKGGGSGWKKR